MADPRLLHITTVDMSIRFLLLGQLRRMQQAGYEAAAMSAPGPWVDDIERAGVRFIPWPEISRRWTPAMDVRALASCVETLRRERFDVVHTHNPKSGLIGRLAARIARVPAVVNTVHGLYSPPGDASRIRRLVLGAEYVAARLSDFELYQSAEDLGRARAMRLVRPGRSAHLGNGVDLDRFDPAAVDPVKREELRKAWGIPYGALVVGMVGRLVREKGWLEFAEAARVVRVSRPDTVFIAIGPDDPDKPDALPSGALGPDVRRCGMTMDMPEALSLLDVFVLASYREGFPRSAIEAAAMGRALVLTDIRGCREVVTQGTDGLLVPPRDPHALAEAVAALVDDPDARSRFGRAAREHALRSFDEAEIVRRTLDVYASLFGRVGAVAAR